VDGRGREKRRRRGKRDERRRTKEWMALALTHEHLLPSAG
jgi:hypothetical protein